MTRTLSIDVKNTAGELDRPALGTLIFKDASLRKKLNKATHLPVFVEMFWQLFKHWLRCQSIVVRH